MCEIRKAFCIKAGGEITAYSCEFFKHIFFRRFDQFYCSFKDLIDPDLQTYMWLPIISVVTLASSVVSVKMAVLSRKVRKDIERQSSILGRNQSEAESRGGMNKSQWRATVSLLIVIGFYVLTNFGEISKSD